MRTRMGTEFNLTTSYASLACALKNIPASGTGYIWARPSARRWVIVGNYAGGRAWNGASAQVVPATAASLEWAARHA